MERQTIKIIRGITWILSIIALALLGYGIWRALI